MNSFNNDRMPGGGGSAGKLATIIVLLTIGLVGIIMYFMKGNSESQVAAPAAQQLFKQDDTPPGYNPAARAESSASGGSLDLLGETNAGYFKDEAAERAAKAAAAAEAAKSVPVKPRAKKTTQKAQAASTVIPRLKTMDSFTSFGDKKKAGAKGAPQGLPPGAKMPQGAVMPDMSTIMKGMPTDGQ